MTRRNAILSLLSAPLGKYNAMQVVEPSHLVINLDNWGGLLVKRGSKSITLSMSDIWEALSFTKQ